MQLDHDEAEIALIALRHFKSDAISQADGRNHFIQVGGAANRCCRHVAAKCDLLIARIVQWQKDEEEERADG